MLAAMPAPVAVSLPGALAVVGVAVFGFAVVIAVCFVVLRLITFVTSGSDEPATEGKEAPSGDVPADEEGLPP
jgi:hypothetical protein